jgi:hypothetical protein
MDDDAALSGRHRFGFAAAVLDEKPLSALHGSCAGERDLIYPPKKKRVGRTIGGFDSGTVTMTRPPLRL